MRLVNLRTLVVGAAGIALAACGDDVTVVDQPPTITLNPASIQCTQGQVTALGVTVGGSSTATPTVAFTSSGTAVTVAGTGSGATVTCASVGSAIITVNVTQNGRTATASVPVTVSAAPIQVTSVQVTPSAATIAVGGTITLTPTVTTTVAGVNTAVTYTSVQPNIATVNANGVVTGVAPGIATIRVASVAAPTVQAVATITVASGADFVQSLSVQPNPVTLTTGTTQALAATVVLTPGAPAGTSRAVTYTSSDTSVVTVSSTGIITARRNGTAVITVASQAAPTVTQQVSVTVRDLAPVRLTIQSVRIRTATGTTPADLNNVAGDVFVTLNLDPGDFRPDSVRLRLGTAIINCQRFSAELAAAYAARLNGSADVQPIECQLNTAQFNATTGAAAVRNGLQDLTAEVFFRPQGAAAGTQTQQAAISQRLTVTNTSGFFVQVTNTPAAEQAAVDADGQATGPQGVLWRAGSINVRVLPVNFQDVPSPGTQVFPITLQDANGIVESRVAVQDAGVATYSVSFPGAPGEVFTGLQGLNGNPVDAIGSRTLNGYTSPNAAIAPAFNPQGQYIGGGTLVVVGTQAGVGNTIVLAANGQPAGLNIVGNPGFFGNAVASPIFIDNQIPQPAVNFGVGGPPNSNFAFTGTSFVGFINAAFNFQNLLTPQFLNNASVPLSGTSAFNVDFGGVDRVTTQFFAGASTSAATLTSGTAITTGAGLAPTPLNTANNLAISLVDALGNRRNQRVASGPIIGGVTNPLQLNATGTAVVGNINNLSFGVDISAPTIAQTAGPTGNVTNNGGANVVLQFAGVDETGFGQNPILTTVTRTARAANDNGQNQDINSNNPGGATLLTYCATAIDIAGAITFSTTSATSCTPVATAGSVTIPAALNGQYSVTVQSRDQAGNTSATTNRIVVVDSKNPVALGISLPPTFTGGAAATIQTGATDNLEIGQVAGEVGYSGILNLQFAPTTIGSPFDNSFQNNFPTPTLTFAIPQFVRSITRAPASIPSQPRFPASLLRAVIFDVVGNSDAVQNAIPIENLNNLSNVSPFVATGNPVTNVVAFSASAQVPGGPAFQSQVQISGGATAGVPTSATITATTQGAVNTFISPFSRLELYVQTSAPGTPQYRFIGSVPAGLVTDNANGNGLRVISSSFTLTATTSPLIVAPNAGQNSYLIIAVGINSTGDALVTDQIQVNIVP